MGARVMLIAIKSCEAHWERCSAIRDTWWTPEVMFFTGPMLGVHDCYARLPDKTKAICQWALEHNVSHLYKTDTDTYVHVPRLLEAPRHDYAGYQLEGKCYASGGAGYWLSRKAMETVAACDPSKFQFEDEMVGTVLLEAGITVHHDSRYALYEDVLPSNSIISRHLSSRVPFEIPMMYEAHRKAVSL